MGIRETQVWGLNEWADQFLTSETVFSYTERSVRIYPDGREAAQPDRPVYKPAVEVVESGEHFEGMFGERYPLHKYTLPDGRVYYERVQAEPWSSGPCIFLAIQDEKEKWVPESLWREEDIEAA